MEFELKRTVQCPKCPWRVDTDPFEIPDGYDPEKHKALSCTIATGNYLSDMGNCHTMACHHSETGNEQHCVGWLWNQLGEGNNIPLRLRMRNCTNIGKIKVIGEQHRRFEDTLPEQ